MPARLAKVSCPHCGAPIRVEVTSQTATCDYCKRISFVHRPKEPVAPPMPGFEDYGHIHIPRSALRNAWIIPFVILFFVFDFVVAGVILVAMFVVKKTSPEPTITVQPTEYTPSVSVESSPTVPLPAGRDCRRLVVCCKALQPSNQGCDMMGIMGEANCARQLPSMQQAARAMGRSCE